MTPCQRFESEGLPRFVAGEPLDAHVESCQDCQVSFASYQKVAAALRQAKDAYVPTGDWEAKVWSRIANAQGARSAARSAARWPALLGLGGALGTVAIFFALTTGGPDTLALTSQVESGPGPRVRGRATGPGDVKSAAPGDVLHLSGKVPRGKLGDLRVYRGTKELVFQCAKSPACVHSKDGLEARVTLDRAGTYRTLLIAADTELPAARGDLDTDYAAALRAGKATESPPVEVL
jgi:hypothetical protein